MKNRYIKKILSILKNIDEHFFLYAMALILTITIVMMSHTAPEVESKVAFDVTSEKIFPTGYNNPDDLYYTFLKGDGFNETQSQKEHFARNGYIATDIGTGGKNLNVYAPSFLSIDKEGNEYDLEKEYVIKNVENYDTMGITIELQFVDDPKRSFAIGHMKDVYLADGEIIKTGTIIGKSGGCPGKLQLREKSTGCHIHFEYRIDGQQVPYPEYLFGNHGEDLEAYKNFKRKKTDGELRIERGDVLAHDDSRYSSSFVSAIHNTENGRCAKNCKTSTAGAKGPMQFMPATWKAYGCDGNGDSKADVNNIDDALCGAQNYLSSLYHNEKKQAPNIEDRWIYWRVACRYNSGYTRPCTHKHALRSVQNYANRVISDMGFKIK